MTIYKGEQFYKPDTNYAMSDAEIQQLAVSNQRMWQAFYGSGLQHVKTDYTAGADGLTTNTVTDDCGIDALDDISGVSTLNTVWNIQSNWLLDDGLKPIYLRFMLGQYQAKNTSNSASYYNRFCGYWYIGEELDTNSNVIYGQAATLYNVWGDSGGLGGTDGYGAQSGQYFLSSYSDGVLHVSQSVADQAPNSYPARHFFLERSRDEAGNIDEKGVVAGLMGSQNAGYGGRQTSYGYNFSVTYEFDQQKRGTWYDENSRRSHALQHFPLTNDVNGYSGTYDNNIVPMSTMVARWGNKWWPSRAFVIVPRNYVAPHQEVFISVNGSPRKYSALLLGNSGNYAATTAPYMNYGNGEQTLALWE